MSFPFSKIKVSQLPIISGSQIVSEDTLHLIKYVSGSATSGNQVYVGDLGTFLSENFVAVSSSYALTASYALNGGGGSGSGVTATGSFTGSFTGSLDGTSSYALTASYFSGLEILPYVTYVGDGTHSFYIITHSLRTTDLLYSMFDAITSQSVIPDISLINTNSISLNFTNVVSASQYQLTLSPAIIAANPTSSSSPTSSFLEGFNVSASIAQTANDFLQYVIVSINGVNYKMPLYAI